MRTKIIMLLVVCSLFTGKVSAQWVVSDPGNLAQGIINASKNIVQTSSTAQNMIKNFQETVKIYQQEKDYYDALKSCLLYTSPSPRDVEESRMPSSA